MQKIHRLSVHLIWMLAGQYILGMLTALFGSQDPGERTPFGSVVFGLHSLLALGIVVSAVILLVRLKQTNLSQTFRVGEVSCLAVIVAFLAGGATVGMSGLWSELSSLIMAVSFLLGFAGYGYLSLVTRPYQRELG